MGLDGRGPRSRGGCRPVWRVFGMAALLVLLCLGPAIARADAIDDETRRIAKQLQCPVCEGVSVADSPSELAGQMRAVIRAKLEQGEPEQRILTYFVERYGDGVLVEPPRRGFALAVWLGPVVVLAAGGAILALLLKRWLHPRWAPSTATPVSPPSTNGRRPTAADPTDVQRYAERARQELEHLRRES